MPSEPHDEMRVPESLRHYGEAFENSLAMYTEKPSQQTWEALNEARQRLTFHRLAAGKPISDLLPRLKKAFAKRDSLRPPATSCGSRTLIEKTY